MNIMLIILIVAALIVAYFLYNQYIKRVQRDNFNDVYVHSRIVDGERIKGVMYPKNYRESMNEKYIKCQNTNGCVFDIHPVEF